MVFNIKLFAYPEPTLEESKQEILSSTPEELNTRLQKMLEVVRGKSGIFPRLERDSWYVILPLLPGDLPRCVRGSTVLSFSVGFPLFSFPRRDASFEEKEKFEVVYYFTYLERERMIREHFVLLSRLFCFKDVATNDLEWVRDMAILRLGKITIENEKENVEKKRKRLDRPITDLKNCIRLLEEELSSRHQEKGST